VLAYHALSGTMVGRAEETMGKKKKKISFDESLFTPAPPPVVTDTDKRLRFIRDGAGTRNPETGRMTKRFPTSFVEVTVEKVRDEHAVRDDTHADDMVIVEAVNDASEIRRLVLKSRDGYCTLKVTFMRKRLLRFSGMFEVSRLPVGRVHDACVKHYAAMLNGKVGEAMPGMRADLLYIHHSER
jgi:hypothetical protein